jgi:cytosine/uracil/thiamine/allantoin permease
VNFAGVLALFTGVVGSLVLSKISTALSQWTWFTGAIIGYVAYYVLYKYWYGKHFPAIPN